MQEDLLERSFEASTAKYKRMHGMHQQAEHFSSQVAGIPESGKQPQDTQHDEYIQQVSTAPPEHQSAPHITYTKAELTDIAELSTASLLNADILSSVRALHLENSLSAIHSTQPQQCSGRQDQAAADMTEIPSSSEGPAQQQHNTRQPSDQSDPASAETASGQRQQAQQQLSSDSQQYTEADWAAYWQYYGYAAQPPPPPPAPQLCSKHMQLLEHFLPSRQEHTQAEAAPAQPATASGSQDTRSALQARAQNLQNGSLTDLLMAWFDAGYQTGKHEALLQQP